MKLMTIYAHPADTITNCGGTLALHADAGDEITALILTHGGRIHPNKYAEEWRKANPEAAVADADVEAVAANKREELRRAAEIIGITKIITFDEEDTGTTMDPVLIERIAQTVADEAPDIIICDFPLNASQYDPHTTATQMALAGIGRASIYLKNLDGRPEFQLRQIYFTRLPVFAQDVLATNFVRNDMFVDISGVVGRKIAAMDCFPSQGYDGDFARKSIESAGGEAGRTAGVNFAEGFVRMYRETHSLLPLTQHALDEDHLTRHLTYSTMNIRAEFPVQR